MFSIQPIRREMSSKDILEINSYLKVTAQYEF